MHSYDASIHRGGSILIEWRRCEVTGTIVMLVAGST